MAILPRITHPLGRLLKHLSEKTGLGSGHLLPHGKDATTVLLRMPVTNNSHNIINWAAHPQSLLLLTQ